MLVTEEMSSFRAPHAGGEIRMQYFDKDKILPFIYMVIRKSYICEDSSCNVNVLGYGLG
jgi:hypothetical protein